MNWKLFVIIVAIGIGAMQAEGKESKFSFKFKEAKIYDVAKKYSDETGERVVVPDSIAKRKINIISKDKVTKDQAYQLMSLALARESVAMYKSDIGITIMHARDLQRGKVEVVRELPKPLPERMVTYVIKLKHASAGNINKRLRILPSKDGELVVASKNELVITDWLSNLYRVRDIITEIDHK